MKTTSKCLHLILAIMAATLPLSTFAISLNQDEVIGSKISLANYNPQTETAAINSILSVLVPGSTSLETGTQFQFANYKNSISFIDSYWVINLPTLTNYPAYFSLKFGRNSSGYTEYFFKNLDSINQLVFSNESVNFATGGCTPVRGDGGCNIDKLSHFTLYGAVAQPQQPITPHALPTPPISPTVPLLQIPPTTVPEPSVISLLLIGILGAFRRGFLNKKTA